MKIKLTSEFDTCIAVTDSSVYRVGTPDGKMLTCGRCSSVEDGKNKVEKYLKEQGLLV